MGDLVGEHIVHRPLDNFVAVALRDPDQLLEDVAGQPFKAAVDSGHARRRVFGLGASPEDFGLGVFAGIAAEIFEQALEDLGVARLVPDLARHIELELPRRVGKVEQGAARGLHGLDFAGEDAVQARAQRFFVEGHDSPLQLLLLADLARLAAAQQHEAILAGQLVNRDASFHRDAVLSAILGGACDSVRGAARRCPDDTLDLLFGEAGQQARFLCDRERGVEIDFLAAQALRHLARVFLRWCARR